MKFTRIIISVCALSLVFATFASAASKLTILSTVTSYATEEVSPEEVLKNVVLEAKKEKEGGTLPSFEEEEEISVEIDLSENTFGKLTLRQFFGR